MSLSAKSPDQENWSPESSTSDSGNSMQAELDDLRSKNEVLKQQLNRAFNAKEEFESLHQKIRDLSSKLSDADKRSETLANRLKISQQRKQELESKISGFCNEIQNLKNSLTASNEKVSEMESKITELEFRKQEAEKDESELKQFFVDVSAATEQKITSFQQIVLYFKTLISENQKKLEENEQMHNEREEALAEALKEVTKKNKKSKKRNDQLQNDNETLHEIIEKTKEQISVLEGQAQELINHNEALTVQNEENEKEIQTARQEAQEVLAKSQEESSRLQQEITKYQDMVTQRDQRIQELNKIMNTPEQTGQTRIAELTQELAASKYELMTISQQKTELEELEKKVEQKLRQAKVKVDNQKAEIAKYKNKLRSLLKSKLTEGETKMRNELEEQSKQCAKYAEEIDKLRIQLQDAQATHVQDETAKAAVDNENEKLQKAIQELEQSANQQKMEITKLNADRSRLINISQKALKELSKYEIVTKQSEAKIKELTQKARNVKPKPSIYEQQQCLQSSTQCDNCILTTISQCLIPQLAQPIREKMSSILADLHIPPQQRVNNICHEIAELLKNQQQKQSTPQTKEITQTSRIESLVDGIIRGFASVIQHKQATDAQASLPISRDHEIIDFITEKTAQLELLLKEKELMSPQFVTLDFMFNGSMEERKRVIQDIACQGWDAKYTFEMFCLQCLINSALDNELITVRNIVESQTAELDHIESVLGTNDPECVVDSLNQISDQMKKLKSKNKKLRMLCVELQNNQTSVDGEESLRNIIDDQQNQIKQITDELDRRKSTIEAYEAEKAQNAKIIESLETEKANLKNEIRQMQFDHRAEIAQFEKSVFAANQETREVNMKMSQQSVEFESKIQEQKRINDNDHSKAVAKQDKLERTINVLKDKQKKLEQTIRSREQENKRETQKLVEAQNQLKAKLADSIEAIKTQTSENQQLSQKLADALRVNEGKAQEMMKEITKLQTSKKAAEVQIQSLQDQMKREAELIESQYKFKSVAEETKHQEEVAQLKAKMDKEKNSLIISVLEEFNALQNLGDEEVDTKTFMSIVHKLGVDYRRIRPQPIC